MNYYPGDDDTKEPIVRWRGHGNLLFSNWLNYFVYQTTPYNIIAVGRESTPDNKIVPETGGRFPGKTGQ